MLTKQLVENIIKGIQEKKGKSIVNLDITQLEQSIADNFIICHGDSNTQVDAIADSVEAFVKKELHERPLHKEGTQNSQWILLDYGMVIVHIFQKEYRDFYNLEGLWADAKIQTIEESK
ncbi:MAG: ribosome silencing factor [Bacteroidetes bacterium]|nr:MAG: ribosome silencing factor [Bacteroidota bacterium]